MGLSFSLSATEAPKKVTITNSLSNAEKEALSEYWRLFTEAQTENTEKIQNNFYKHNPGTTRDDILDMDKTNPGYEERSKYGNLKEKALNVIRKRIVEKCPPSNNSVRCTQLKRLPYHYKDSIARAYSKEEREEVNARYARLFQEALDCNS